MHCLQLLIMLLLPFILMNKIDVYHISDAHTEGDSIIYFSKRNVIHTRDLYVNGRYQFIDHSSGGSIDGLKK